MSTRREFIQTAGATIALASLGAQAQSRPSIGIVGFQMSSETHARVANAAEAAAKAKGWTVQVLNSRGEMPVHISQFDTLIQAKVSGIIVAMGKPAEADAQFKKAKDAGIPVITVMSGASPHAPFDISVNEYSVGARAAIYMLDQMNYRGNILTERFDGNTATRIRGKVLDAVVSENTAIKVLGTHTMARTGAWRDDVKAGMSALLLKNQGQIDGIWASFDGQAYVIDDMLQQTPGATRGKPVLVSVDGGVETYRRIADPKSFLLATMAIPFERMGTEAVNVMERLVVKKEPHDSINAGPYIYMQSDLVDKTNVAQYLKK
jgi:simple sugar transport system substrate-binding protein/ribose transport system substrate-binding protein